MLFLTATLCTSDLMYKLLFKFRTYICTMNKLKNAINIIGLMLIMTFAVTACNNGEKCKDDCKKECCDSKKECKDDCEKECCADKEKECCKDGEKCEKHQNEGDVEATDSTSTTQAEAHVCGDDCHANGCTAKVSSEKKACKPGCEKECCSKA